MGRGLGPTQQKVLQYLENRWQNPTDPTFVGVRRSAVAAELATTHSEAQAIRRAIRGLLDRKEVGTAHLMNEFDTWLVPVGENAYSTDPRPRAQGKLQGLREAIRALLTDEWQPVASIRAQVLGERPATAAEGAWDWDARRQLFNRALGQLRRAGTATVMGSSNKANQDEWQARLATELEREWMRRSSRKQSLPA